MKTQEEPMGRMEAALRRSGAKLPANVEDVFASAWTASTPEPRLTEVPRIKAPVSQFRGFNALWQPKLVATPGADPVLVEQFRRLAALVHHAQTENGSRVLLVVSAEPSEGKSLVATNLGLTLASSYGREVLLLDADLRRPSLHTIAQLPNDTGLAELIGGDVDGKLPTYRIADRLTIAPAGKPLANPTPVLTSPRMADLIVEAAQRFDWVIVDAPPAGMLVDATLLLPVVDCVLFVVRSGSTHYAAAQRAIDAIGRDRILGVVLNGTAPSETEEYRHYYDSYAPSPAGTKSL